MGNVLRIPEEAQMYLTKGSRVVARWYEATDGAVAGMQPKVSARETIVSGIVTHVRGDRPLHPTTVGVWVRTDDGTEVGPFDVRHVVSVESP